MPTELEELVDFLSHGNTQVRQLATENLVPYSLSQPSIFKTNQLLPIKDLKLLVRDYKQIASHAITILINLSTDSEVLKCLATDKEFTKSLFSRITNPTEPNANLLCMLLANLIKHDTLAPELLTNTQPSHSKLSCTSSLVISQLLDLFVRGSDGTYNASADYDYLSYVFADLAKYATGRSYLLKKQPYDSIIPLTKLIVFTEHKSLIRRKGVASTIKNVAFEIPSHISFLSDEEINILPYILLPLTGSEEYDEEDAANMLPDLQLLPPDKEREKDARIVETHVETLMLLSTTREGRDVLRGSGVYPVVRETHLRVEDEQVREVCERLVQVLMRDGDGDGKDASEGESNGGMKALTRGDEGDDSAGGWVGMQSEQKDQKVKAVDGGEKVEVEEEDDEDDDDDDDDKIVEV